MPTLRLWRGPFVAVDIKGELANHFMSFSCNKRKVIILNPFNPDSLSVDPFEWLELDGEDNLLSNISSLATIFILEMHGNQDPFWDQSERAILTAALLCYYRAGLSFPQAITRILDLSLIDLYRELSKFHGEAGVKHLIGNLDEMKQETIASIERGMKNKLLLLANEEKLLHFFRGKRENAPISSLTELEESAVFIQVPQEMVERWGSGITLLLTMVLTHLEHRPEAFSPEAVNMQPFLIAIDEFPRFGRLPIISSSLETLRSKAVNLLLAVQSISQLEALYGRQERASIMDCCAYRVILQVADPENQRLIADMIGTIPVYMPGYSASYDLYGFVSGYSAQLTIQRQYIIQPSELACISDAVLATPYGTFIAGKIPPEATHEKHPSENIVFKSEHPVCSAKSRSAEASRRVKVYTENLSTTDADNPDLIAFTLGKLIQRYFPDYLLPESNLEEVDNILCAVATDTSLLNELKHRAKGETI